MKNSRFIFCCAFAALCCAGCFKSVSYNTTYVLRPSVQTENQGGFTSLPGVIAYAFSVDTTGWMVASYTDALAGIITSKRTSEKMTNPTAVSMPYPPSDTIPSSVDWIQMQVGDPVMMIVAVDSVNKIYAYRQQDFAENLSPYFVAVNFRSWRGSYTEGAWRMVNEFYVPPKPDPDPEPDTPDTPDDTNPDNPTTPSE